MVVEEEALVVSGGGRVAAGIVVDTTLGGLKYSSNIARIDQRSGFEYYTAVATTSAIGKIHKILGDISMVLASSLTVYGSPLSTTPFCCRVRAVDVV
ncbi:hypothetical protein Tco_0651006 [Tanacetum coccineum]